jgi:hypothetical protein
MTYRITPQCGHPSLKGGLHDHGPECLFAFEWRESMPGPGEVTFVPYASAEEADAMRSQEPVRKVKP